MLYPNCSEKMLYPSCSEVCWRLNFNPSLDTKERIVNTLMGVDEFSEENSTSDTNTGTMETFLYYLKEAEKKGLNIDKIDLDMIENTGGNENFVYDMWELANRVMNNEISLSKAIEEEANWEG